MAVQNPFFGKREPESFTPRSSAPLNTGSAASSASAYGTAAGTPATGSSTASSGVRSSAATSAVAAQSGGSKLTVGPNIKLKGVEITDCDTLVVEGTVEATMDSRVIHIAEQGAFHGSAEIDIAEIHGSFEGNLTVREKLVIFSTGRVNGTIRYGRVVIEEGGQLSGDIQVGTGKVAAASGKSVSLGTASASSTVPASTASSTSGAEASQLAV